LSRAEEDSAEEGARDGAEEDSAADTAEGGTEDSRDSGACAAQAARRSGIRKPRAKTADRFPVIEVSSFFP